MPTGRLVRQALLAKPTAKRPDVVQGLGGITASPTLLGPVLVRSQQQNYLRLLLTVRYFTFSYGCCRGNPIPRRKAGMEMNEMNNMYVSLLTSV